MLQVLPFTDVRKGFDLLFHVESLLLFFFNPKSEMEIKNKSPKEEQFENVLFSVVNGWKGYIKVFI